MNILDIITAGELVAALVIVFNGSVIQGTVGFGLGLVAVPVLALIDPGLVPVVPIGLAVPLVAATPDDATGT